MASVVLVHDWLNGMRGGEKCLEVAARLWPDSRLFTLLHKRGAVSPPIERLRPRASWLQHFPFAQTHYRHMLPLMPVAVGSLRLPRADLVLSFSHCVAKAVNPNGARHVCYCFTPMRYVWHMRSAYFAGRVRGIASRLLDAVLDRLRDWDRDTATRVHEFVAISRTVQGRIRECYGRESAVIYPPADTDFYTPDRRPRGDHYLVLSAFAPYKRLDLAIDACRMLRRKLIVIGAGQDEARLKGQKADNVTFLGWQSDEAIRDHLRTCRALLFPGEEDFGIVPVEGMACGAPVIAYGKGGATETVVPGKTGVWFDEQTPGCLAEALERFERMEDTFDPAAARRQAVKFALPRFERELASFVEGALPGQARAA